VTSYNTISKVALSELFESIAAETAWDMRSSMMWSYFFADQDQAKLEALRPILEIAGYRFVTYLESPSDDTQVYFLQVDRVETHSVDSLHTRNENLALLAYRFGLTYDGLDVAPVDVMPAIEAE
jgi:hypothetical protein